MKFEATAPELKGETHPVDALANLLKVCTQSPQIYLAAFDVTQRLKPKGATFPQNRSYMSLTCLIYFQITGRQFLIVIIFSDFLIITHSSFLFVPSQTTDLETCPWTHCLHSYKQKGPKSRKKPRYLTHSPYCTHYH